MTARIGYNPANLVTIFKTFLGFFSIILIALGDPFLGAKLILIALILDGVDGKIARFFKYVTDYGATLDNLSDIVSFGLAPAVFMFFVLDANIYLRGIVCSLFLACLILQLSRSTFTQTTKTFVGLPIHITTLAIIGIFISTFYPFLLSVTIIIIVSILMLSNLSYPSLKSGREQLLLFIPVMLILGILFFDSLQPILGLLLSFVSYIYIIGAPIYGYIKKIG